MAIAWAVGEGMENRFAMYPIAGVAGDWLDEPFDLTALPATIVPGVIIEDTEGLFSKKDLDLWKGYLSKRELDSLRQVKFAIIYRYSEKYPDIGGKADLDAETLVRSLGACLRLVRPMQQDASFISGRVRGDSTLDIQRFENPQEMHVPAIQRLFLLRNRDVVRLQKVANQFLRAFAGNFWKFRIAVGFHEAGHFSHAYWKGRFSLWCSALEAIFTSNSYQHKGTVVAKERIKWFLGPTAPIYELGDIQAGQTQLTTTVEDLVDDLYELRNTVAHGDKTPDRFFNVARREYSEDVLLVEVLTEAISRIIRGSLLRILEGNLLNAFADGPASETYFGSHGLTRDALYAKLKTKP
jgi:hypothetical protein